jgi:sulfate transport system permease protein
MPLISEITPLLIISKLEQYDVVGATALACVMLAMSFVLLLAVNGAAVVGGESASRRERVSL